MSYQHGKLILQSTCSVILRMYKLLHLQHAFWRPSFNVSWNIVLFIWWKHVSDFLKHNFETYRFIKQQIMILFSGTMKWNMFQIHLKEMHPLDSCSHLGYSNETKNSICRRSSQQHSIQVCFKIILWKANGWWRCRWSRQNRRQHTQRRQYLTWSFGLDGWAKNITLGAPAHTKNQNISGPTKHPVQKH